MSTPFPVFTEREHLTLGEQIIFFKECGGEPDEYTEYCKQIEDLDSRD